MEPITGVTAEQLTRALGEAVIRIWSSLPRDVQNHLFQEAVTSQGESIRPQLAVFLHDKHPRTSDPLGKPRVAVPGYTLAPDARLTDIVAEIRQAMSFLSDRAGELGFDGSQIYIGGWSAGGT
jgi:predicted esterase